MEDDRSNRREFVVLTAAVCASAAVPGCGPKHFKASYSGSDETIAIKKTEFEELRGALGLIFIDVPGLFDPVILRELPEDATKPDRPRYSAVWSVCSHQYCRVTPSRKTYRCDCHSSSFDLDGSPKGGPAAEPLTNFTVSTNGDDIFIKIPKDAVTMPEPVK